MYVFNQKTNITMTYRCGPTPLDHPAVFQSSSSAISGTAHDAIDTSSTYSYAFHKCSTQTRDNTIVYCLTTHDQASP